MDRGFSNRHYRALIELLIAARKEADLSQTALAAKLESRQQFVSKYETGERRLDAIEVLEIADALGADGYKMLREARGTK